MTTLTREVAQKVLQVVDAGLVRGVGIAVPGRMCVEAAVCYALGEPHGDTPSCVGAAVRAYKIRLNDARWSSNEARSKGLRAIAIAQLGSNEIDQKEFSQRLVLAVIREILPSVLTRRGLHKNAKECASATTLKEANKAAKSAAYAVNAANAADAVLIQAAGIGVRILTELKSPGAQWLDLL